MQAQTTLLAPSLQLPPFAHGSDAHCSAAAARDGRQRAATASTTHSARTPTPTSLMLVWQSGPLQPATHAQLTLLTPSLQLPPFAQGALAHSLMLVWQAAPLQPGTQPQSQL